MYYKAYQDFALEDNDSARCNICDQRIPFNASDIDDLIAQVDAHECDLPKEQGGTMAGQWG